MKLLFDTSALIAAFVEHHEFHHRAYPWLEKVSKGKAIGYVCQHSIAELYSILSNLPLRPRIFPEMAARLIRENLKSLRKVALNPKDYAWCVEYLSSIGQPGAVIYDALTARAAIKSQTDHLVTFDPDDFRRVLPPEYHQIILVPS